MSKSECRKKPECPNGGWRFNIRLLSTFGFRHSGFPATVRPPTNRRRRAMAGFKTHITTSTVLGVGYGVGAHMLYGVPIPTCALAAGLCSVSGMLPDID